MTHSRSGHVSAENSWTRQSHQDSRQALLSPWRSSPLEAFSVPRNHNSVARWGRALGKTSKTRARRGQKGPFPPPGGGTSQSIWALPASGSTVAAIEILLRILCYLHFQRYRIPGARGFLPPNEGKSVINVIKISSCTPHWFPTCFPTSSTANWNKRFRLNFNFR